MRRVAAHFVGWAFIAASGVGGDLGLAADEPAPLTDVRRGVGDVSVHALDPADATIARAGADDATGFLGANGFDVSLDLSIDVVPSLPPAARASAAGCYLRVERRIVILTFSKFQSCETWFHVPIDAALYRSLVSHEVAHAIAAYNFKVVNPSIQADEYVAYVTMLATMAPALRERVLSQFPGHGFEDEQQMSSTIYLVDPMRFGVQAYRHFLRRANGREYLHAILTGKVLRE